MSAIRRWKGRNTFGPVDSQISGNSVEDKMIYDLSTYITTV